MTAFSRQPAEDPRDANGWFDTLHTPMAHPVTMRRPARPRIVRRPPDDAWANDHDDTLAPDVAIEPRWMP